MGLRPFFPTPPELGAVQAYVEVLTAREEPKELRLWLQCTTTGAGAWRAGGCERTGWGVGVIPLAQDVLSFLLMAAAWSWSGHRSLSGGALHQSHAEPGR